MPPSRLLKVMTDWVSGISHSHTQHKWPQRESPAESGVTSRGSGKRRKSGSFELACVSLK